MNFSPLTLTHRSVYDLVKASQWLKLTDYRLLSWYLTLSTEDRRLIEEEGGFVWFLQRHPALEVDQEIVHLKSGPGPWFTTEAERRCLLCRSVFHLIKANQWLELTDRRLLGWYLTLSPEDRKLIQEEGGFFQFLRRHPDLEVDREIVHLKNQEQKNYPLVGTTDMSSNLNRSRRPSFYGVSQCPHCGSSCASDAKKCRRCNTVVKFEKESELRPCNVNEELTLWNADSNESSAGGLKHQSYIQNTLSNSISPQTTPQDHFQSATEGRQITLDPSVQKDARSVNAQLLPKMWEEELRGDGACNSVFKDQTAQASFSLDVDLDTQSKSLRSEAFPHTQHQQHGQLDDSDLPDLQQETLPEYYSFNSTGLDRTYAESNDGSLSADYGCSDSLIASKGSPEFSVIDEPPEGSKASFCVENPDFTGSVSLLSMSPERTDNTEDFSVGQDDFNDSMSELKMEEYHSVMADGSPVSTEGTHRLPEAVKPYIAIDQCSLSKKQKKVECEESLFTVGPNDPAPHGVSNVTFTVTQMVDASGDFRACFTCTRATDTRHASDTLPAVACGDEAVDRHVQTIAISTAEKYAATEICISDLELLTEEFMRLKVAEKELMQLKQRAACLSSARGTGSEGHREDCECDCAQRAKRVELQLLALQFRMCQQHCWRCYYTSSSGESALFRSEPPPDTVMETLRTLEVDYQKIREQILAGVPLTKLQPLCVDFEKITTETCYCPATMCVDCAEDVPSKTSVDLQTHKDEGHSNKGRGTDAEERKESHASKDSVITKVLSFCLGMNWLRRGDGWRECLLFIVYISVAHTEINGNEAWYDAEEDLDSASQSWKENQEEGKRGGADGEKSSRSSVLLVTDVPSHATEGDMKLQPKKNPKSGVCISTLSDHARAKLGDQRSSKESCATFISTGSRAGPAGDGQYASRSESNVIQSSSFRPLRSSLEKLTHVQNTPTASGTCIAQHYATMSSFDTLMAQLTERHPEVGRQGIVNALLELRAKHGGSLCGMPLRSIVDMISDLLTQSSTTQCQGKSPE
ncbi:RNA-binding protein 44 [Chanos chanos]|uniref:RNA-binding protein 44 n=1 Tax=Chanos chanos TaxID=29144 RepID=A0A6J2WJC5_CHACN|nr:RNA-binding protein 44 [Chanos chanos]